MSLGFYGGRPLIPQGMVPVMVPGSNASLLGSPPGQVRPLLGQQVQAMGVQPGAALPPGVMQPGLLGQAPPPMMGARMPVAGQMIIPGQEEAMPVTTMAGLDAMKQEPVDPSPEDLADTPIPISAPAAAAGTPQVPLATPHSMMAMSAGSPPVVGQSPLQHGLPTSVQSFQGALPTSVHSLHSALQAGTVQPIMAQGALPASVHSVVGQHGTIPGSLFSQAMGGAMSMGSVQSVMNPGAIPGMMPGQPALPTGVPGFIPGAGPLVTMGMGLQPQMVGGALPAGMALPPGYATSMEAAYKNLGEASLIKQEEFEYEEPPPVIDESNPPAVLDAFNSDLNLKIEPDGLTAESVTDPMGFCFCWAGARAAYGVTSGKACFEVKITKHLTVDFGEEHKEQDPHVMRLGWAVDSASFQLGEVAESYGYGGTGRFSVNMKFKNYGNVFGKGDVITALLDLNPRNPTISFCKNGTHMGIAQKLKSCETPGLFPAILLKNVRVECNFGQRPPWFQPPEGYSFIDHMMAEQKVRGMQAPERQQDCELIMIVGLPGAGKTTWGIKMQEENFEKRYNIIGTDTLIEKMRVNGLPRKNNYHGRWEVLISKATACLNTLFSIGSKLSRNYILDQTNVYASARRRKLRNFYNFKKILAVIQPDDDELKRREYKRTYEDGKFVPEDAVNEMKSNFTLPSDGDEYVDEIRWVELDMKSCLPLVDMYNRVKGPRNDSGRGRGRGGRGGYGGGGHDNRKRYGDHGDNRSGQQGYGPPGEKKMRQDGDRSGLDYIKQEYDDKGNSGESQASGQWSHDAGSRPPGDGYGNSYNRSYGGSSGQQNWNQSGLKPGESPWGQDGNQAQSTWQQQRDQGPRWQQDDQRVSRYGEFNQGQNSRSQYQAGLLGESPNISGSLLGAPPPPPPQGTDRGGRYDDSGRSGPYSKEDSKSYRDDRRSGQYRDDKSWDRRGGSNDRSSSGRYQSGGDRGDSSRGSSGGGSSSWQQRKPWEKQEEGSDRRGDKESGSRYSREDRGRGEGRSDSYRSQGGGSSSGGQWNQSGDSRRDRGYGSPDGDQPPPPPKEESSRDSRGGGYGRDERSGAYGGYNERGRGDDRGGSWSSSSKQSGGRDEGRHESRSDYGKQYGSSGGSQQHGGRYGSDSKDKEQRYDSYYDDHNGDDSARDKKERKSRWDTNEGEGGEENKSSSSGGVKEEPAAAKQPEDRQSGINQQQQKGPSVESSPTQQGNAENIQQNIQDGGNSGPGLLGQYGGPPVIGKAQPMGNMQELIQRPPPSMGGPGGGPGGPPQFGGGGHFQNQPAMMRGPPPPSLMNAPPPHRGGGMMNNPDRFPHPGGGPPPGFGGRGGFQGGRGQGPMHGGRGGGFRGRGFGGPRGGGYGGPPRGGGGFHRGGRGGMF